MKFKFDKNLDYQLDAISSIVDIFDTGNNLASGEEILHVRTTPIVSNELEIDQERIQTNIIGIQKQNGIKQVGASTSWGSSQWGTTPWGESATAKQNLTDFSIEMETGTGKTYVYLRTILELNKRYGLNKFIILVPSVAIREGVLKTIEQTKQHFEEIYNNKFGYFAYDSQKLSKVRDFAQSLGIQIMIMTIQSFNKDDNIMRQTPDRFHGESPLGIVAQTRPIVIMDEPQNMESELSKSSIADLNSLFKLRYSATHKEFHNLMYRLTPFDAYKNGLVKQIEIFGTIENDQGAFIFRVEEIKTQKGQNPQAKVFLEIKQVHGDFVLKEVLLKSGDSLFRKTNNSRYEGLLVNEIDARTNKVELSDGKFYTLNEQIQENKEAIFRTQIRETIKAHMRKQEEVGSEIKVLSLFFIDRVDNYVKTGGLIRKIFIEEYEKLKDSFDHFRKLDVNAVHNGYFSQVKEKGIILYKDTSGTTKADKEIYDLIMKDKEKLLAFAEPISFVFSHSALKEGWDNPNIFQICTLREVASDKQRRQQIGRGLRLAVDINGDRIFDPKINILTVIANESYKEFVGRLQAEYDEAGYRAPQTSDGRKKVSIKFKKYLESESEDFKKLWEKIRKRTRFNMEINTDQLIKKSIDKINELNVSNLVIKIEKVQIDFDNKGKIKTLWQNSSIGERLDNKIKINNIIDRLSKEIEVTKTTIFKILSSVENLDLIFENPEEYVRSCSVIIKGCLNELLINDGLKYLPINDVWEISLFEDFDGYIDRSIELSKGVYSRIMFDSEGEREFATSLEQSRNVNLFTKLPPKFVVETPLGEYHPDWAIVVNTDKGEKLYLVRESKFIGDLEELRNSEKQKIICGEKHFIAIDVDFNVVQKTTLEDLIK